MSKLESHFGGKRRKGRGLSLGQSWGGGGNALAGSWGGRKKRSGGFLARVLGRARGPGDPDLGAGFGPQSFKRRTLLGATTAGLGRSVRKALRPRKRGRKRAGLTDGTAGPLAARIVGTPKKRKRTTLLTGVPGSLLEALGTARGKQADQKAATTLRSVAAAFAVAGRLARDDRPPPAAVVAEALEEGRQHVTRDNAQAEAVQSKDLLLRLADWLRARFRRSTD